MLIFFLFLLKQTGEYATDDEDTGTTAGGEKNIEVFDLPETEDNLSPSELDATKLYQKFREVNLLPLHTFMQLNKNLLKISSVNPLERKH